ncbi:MAG: hypothetical protein ACFE7R_08845, partial [Candidatus Hodarchaeota archaeon]
AFIDSLKKTIDSNGGITSNVKVTIASNHKMAFEAIMALADTRLENSTLIVIDPVTRVLDMSRQNPAMWGQELIEEVLPTLAGLTNSDNGIFVVITSEVRQLSQDGNSPIHHRVIRRWSNKEYLVRRTPVGKQSEIVRIGDDVERIVGRLTLLEDGTVDLSVEVTIEGGVE